MAITVFDPATSRDAGSAGCTATNNDLLESWKEIAAYLNRTVRTVRRWEESEALPVHRHEHNRQATVYAFRSELDAWLMKRQPEASDEKGASPAARGLAPEPATIGAHAPVAALPPTGGFFIPRWLILSGATAGIGFALFVLYGVFFANWRFMILL